MKKIPILGIDYNKCINCGICVIGCSHPDYYFTKNEEGKVIHDAHGKVCITCGQCIAQCPEEAILYEDIGEPFTFEGVNAPNSLVSYDEMFKSLVACRSVRRYKREKVPQEILDKVIQAMIYAPTAANVRSEKFTIVSDSEIINTISDAIEEEFRKDETLREQFWQNVIDFKKFFRAPLYFDAPHIIFISSPFNMLMGGFNIGNIITYGRLAAQSLGLGTCWSGWTHLAFHKNPKLKKLAKIRGNLICAFTIGYPDVKYYRVPPRSQKKVNII